MRECDIQYDKYGRMLYNPEFHSKNCTKWKEEEVQYLIQWYEIIGAEEMSFALERTMPSIQHKVSKLRKKGRMKLGRASYKRRELGGRNEYMS